MIRNLFSSLRASSSHMSPSKTPPQPTVPAAIKSRDEAVAGEGGMLSFFCFVWVGIGS